MSASAPSSHDLSLAAFTTNIAESSFRHTQEMTVRKLCDVRLGLYASSDYLARHAPIVSVDDFTGHDAIIFRAGSGKTRPWTV